MNKHTDMKQKWYVTICVMDTIEVEADSRDEAEALALDIFDPNTADGPSVHDSWEIDEQTDIVSENSTGEIA